MMFDIMRAQMNMSYIALAYWLQFVTGKQVK